MPVQASWVRSAAGLNRSVPVPVPVGPDADWCSGETARNAVYTPNSVILNQNEFFRKSEQHECRINSADFFKRIKKIRIKGLARIFFGAVETLQR